MIWGDEEGWSNAMVHSRPLADKRVLFVGPFQRVYFLGEYVLEWNFGTSRRHMPMAPPAILWVHLLVDDNLAWVLRGTLAIRRVAE